MNEQEIKSIEYEIQSQLQLRSNYINIVVVLVSGVIGLFLSTINLLKVILIILGFSIIILFLATIENCNQQIKLKIRELKNG